MSTIVNHVNVPPSVSASSLCNALERTGPFHLSSLSLSLSLSLFSFAFATPRESVSRCSGARSGSRRRWNAECNPRMVREQWEKGEGREEGGTNMERGEERRGEGSYGRMRNERETREGRRGGRSGSPVGRGPAEDRRYQCTLSFGVRIFGQASECMPAAALHMRWMQAACSKHASGREGRGVWSWTCGRGRASQK